MQILFALIFGAAYGGALHFTMDGRTSRGAALAPLVGAVLGGLVYTALTWAGLAATSVWLWIAALGAPTLVVPLALIALTRSRATHDAQERLRLKLS